MARIAKIWVTQLCFTHFFPKTSKQQIEIELWVKDENFEFTKTLINIVLPKYCQTYWAYP